MKTMKVFIKRLSLFSVWCFPLLMACICILFSFILYSPVLGSYFVSEDLYHINFRWSQVIAEFSSTGPIIGFRPGTVVYLVVNNLLWRRNPIGHHAAAILLHGLVGSFTFLIVRRVTREPLTAILAAMIFVGAPVHSEAVIWLAAAAGTVTSGLICMVAAWLWVRGSPKPSQLMVGLVATLYLLALLVKEVAFPLPALLILLDWAMKRIPSLKTPRIVVSQLFFYWPFGLAIGVYAFLHWQAGALGSSFDYGVHLNAGFEQVSKGWSSYTSSLFQPLSSFVKLDAVYWIWLGIFLVLLYAIDRARWASMWVLIALLPGATAYGERLTYLAMVGFSIVVAVGLVDSARLFSSWLKPKFKEVYFLFTIGICVFVIFLLIADIYNVRQREANWIEAGRLTWTIPRRAKRLLSELPSRAELYFVDLPDNVNGAFAFHWGIEPEVRYVYHNSHLIVRDVTHDPSQWSKVKVSSITCKTEAPRFFFQYFAPTDELRLVTLPELGLDCR